MALVENSTLNYQVWFILLCRERRKNNFELPKSNSMTGESVSQHVADLGSAALKVRQKEWKCLLQLVAVDFLQIK